MAELVLPPEGTPCQGVTSKGPCECPGWVKASGMQGMYVVCANCGQCAQVHYVPSEEMTKVKR